MKKLYLVILLLGCLLYGNVGFGQCDYILAPTTTQLTCHTTSITLVADPAITNDQDLAFFWSTGETTPTITVTDSGTYIFYVEGPHHYSCTDSIHITKNTIAPPLTLLTFPPAAVCSGSSFTLTATGADIYYWGEGDLTPDSFHTYTPIIPDSVHKDTTLFITGTDTSNGCVNYAIPEFRIDPPLHSIHIEGDEYVCSGSPLSLTAVEDKPAQEDPSYKYVQSFQWTQPYSQSGNTFSDTPINTSNDPENRTYTVTGTSTQNVCTSTDSYVVLVLPSPATSISASSTAVCEGGSVTLTATGADAGYIWDDGTNDPIRTVTPASSTSYIVDGFGAYDCSTTDTVTVVVNPLPDASISVTSQYSCRFDTASPPRVIFTGSGGTSPYTFVFSYSGFQNTITTNAGSDTASVLIPTEDNDEFLYVLDAVTDSNGCTNNIYDQRIYAYVVGKPALVSQTDITITSGSPFTYTADANIHDPNAYFWTRTDTTGISATGPSSGTGTQINDTLTNNTMQPIVVNYVFTITSIACTTTDTVRVTVNPVLYLTNAKDTSICSGSSFTYTAESSVANTTFSWTRPDVAGISATDPSSGDSIINNTLTNNTSQPLTVSYVFTLSADDSTTTETIQVTVNPLPIITVQGPTFICSGSPVTLTASGAENYDWEPGGLSGSAVIVTPTETTPYTVTGTDANGCTNTAFYTLVVNPLPGASVSATHPSACQNDPQPEIVFTGSGQPPFTFFYSDNYGDHNIATSADETSVGVGVSTDQPGTFTYTLNYVIDGNGCAHTIPLQEADVTIDAAPVITIQGPSSRCIGNSATLTASGADTYLWEPDSLTGPSISVTPDTTTLYKLTGTITASGCTGTASFNLVVNSLPDIVVQGPDVVCSGSSATLTASGAETYEWEPGSLSGSAVIVTPTETTPYTVTGTDANGCTNTAYYTLVVDLPFAAVSATKSSACQGDPIQPEVIFTGSGQPPFTFVYNGGQSITTKAGENSAVIQVPTDQPGTFTYTLDYVIDSFCIHTIPLQEADVTILPTPDLNIQASQSAICSGSTVTLTASGADTYQWQSPSSTNTTISVTPDSTTSYIVTGTNEGGCTNTYTSVVVVNPIPNAYISATTDIACQSDTANAPKIIFTGLGGTSPYTFTFERLNDSDSSITTNFGSDTAELTVPVDSADSYQYSLNTVTDSNGCANEVGSRDNVIAVLIEHKPFLVITDTTINNGSSFIYYSSNVAYVTSYSWTRQDVAGISATGPGSGNGTINNTLTNNTSQPIVVNYIFDMTNGTCSSIDTVKVTVNPVLYLTNAKDTSICSGSPFTYTAKSSVTNTTFSWTRPDVTGISATGPDSGDSIINNTLTNNTLNSIPVTYFFTLTAGSYFTTDTVQVTVNPLPSLSSQKDTSVCSDSLFTYTAASLTGTAFTWTRPAVTGITTITPGNGYGATVTDLLTNTTLLPVPVKYFFTIAAGGACTGTDSLTVTVNPVPALISTKDTAICSGIPFTYTATGNLSSTKFNWSRRDTTGILATGPGTGSGTINDTLTNNTPQPVKVTYVFTLEDNCNRTDSITVTVNPAPLLTSTKDTAICSSTPFTYTAASSAQKTFFNWTRLKVPHISATGSESGSGATLNDVLTNDTTQPVTEKYFFTLSVGNGCSEIDSLQVILNPVPYLVSTKDTSACSDLLFTYTAKSSISGTKFSWTRDSVANILPVRGTGSDGIISETLSNSTSQPAKVNYIFTFALSNGCIKKDSVQVTVNPAPTLTSPKEDTACSGVPFVYTATSLPGTSFSWIRPAIDEISAPANSNSGPTINETFTNATSHPVPATYIFTLTLSGGCSKIDTVQVTVNPTPKFISEDKDTTCSGSLFTYTAKSTVPGTRFSWTRDFVANILPATATGSDSTISETLTNNTLYPIPVTYSFTLQAGQNCTETGTLDVIVNPTPKLASSKDTIKICSTQPFSYVAKDSVNYNPTTYLWTRKPVKGILPDSSSGTTAGIISESLINTTTDSITVTYLITLTTNDGCSSIDSIKVTVLAAPVLSAGSTVSDTAFCNGFYVDKGLHFSSSTQGASITWESDTKAVGFSDIKGGSYIPPFEATNMGTDPLTANVTVTVTGDIGCGVANFPFMVTVNPTPHVTEISQAAFCNGDSVSNGIQFTSIPSQKDSIWWQSNTDIGFGTSPGSGNIPLFVAEGNSTTLRNAIITVRVTDTSIYTYCADTTAFNVAVNPVPALASTSDTTICSGSPLAYPVQSSVAGTTFSWTRRAVPGILPNSDNSGTTKDAIRETLINLDTVPITVTYQLTLIGYGCPKDTMLSVTVNPAPRINTIGSYAFCNNELASNGIKFSSPTPDSSFTWQSDINVGFGVALGANNIDSFTAYNPDDINRVANVTVTATDNSNGCTSYSIFPITVYPSPPLKKPDPIALCNGTHSDGILFSPADANTNFIWKSSSDVGFGLNSKPGTDGQIDAFTVKGNSEVPVIASVSVRAISKSTGCSSGDSTFTVTVYPSPGTPDFTYSADTSFGRNPLILCDSSENINFNITSSQAYINGISYTWSASGNSKVNIKNKQYPNTVITFSEPGTFTITAEAQYGNTTCVSTASRDVIVKDQRIDISRRKIFLKQPGNMLVYPDNSFTNFEHSIGGYQWGYDSVYQTSPLATSKPIDALGQIYQFYVPDPASCRCIKDGSLDTTNFYYWVLLKDTSGCSTKVYYKGLFDDEPDSVRLPPPVTVVQLQVIPNPNSGVFDISLKGNMYGNIEAQVYNSGGQVVFQKRFVKSTVEATEKFITGGLPAGVYFLVLRSSDLKEAHTRFIISR